MSDVLESSFHPGARAAVTEGLMTREDGPSLRRAGQQLGVLLGVMLLSAVLPALRPLTTIALAMGFAALFAPWHESLHGTAFVSPGRNHALSWSTGLVFLAAPTTYRAFHFAHHRHTQDPKLDPEIAFAPEVLGAWPSTPLLALFRLSGLGIAFGKLGLLFMGAFAPASAWDTVLPYIRPEARARARAESWVVLAWGLGWSVLGAWFPVIGGWVQAWWLSHVFLAWWLTTEHTGLPADAPILARTRTVLSHGWVRWWTWNMGYHAEHHAWPGVPWHHLPTLHTRVRGELPRVWDTYLSVWTRR